MGNCHALFGKGPTEKGSDMSTSPVTYFTREGGLGKRTGSNLGAAPQADPTGAAPVVRRRGSSLSFALVVPPADAD
jgi:hypothetical protein